jgi:hypothetical protein
MDTIVVFTKKDLEVMFEQGGSGDWVANEDRLSKCVYLVAAANAYAAGSGHDATKHAHAFLVGKISGVKDAPESPGRKIIQFDEYAEIDIPKGWVGQRNPVRYTELSEFGLSPEQIQWISFPADRVKEYDLTPELTVEEAKRGLAKKLGVSPKCIEITIRA